MRDRVKVLQRVAAEAALSSMLPGTARAAIAELVALNAELVGAVESLQGRLEYLEHRDRLAGGTR
jgi:hypothetical protein